MPVHTIKSEEQTAALAAEIARAAKPGDMFLLRGNLGAGKSTFARAFIQSLCGPETEVPSPTFTLVQTYEAPNAPIWHFDLYRLQHPDEIFEIGFEEALRGISLIEWPERLGIHKPRHAKTITIDILDDEKRKIAINE